MKNFFKSGIALLLVATMLCTFTTGVFATGIDQSASNAISESMTSSEYLRDDGVYVEEVSFVENGEFAAVIKKTNSDGTFEVEAINGESSIIFVGTTDMSAPHDISSARDITYPHYTPYWLAGHEDYSQNGTALTVAIIAGLIVANTGLGASAATTVASSIYTALGSNIYSNVYFRTYRYYATMEYAPGTITWYNKFVTYSYSDSARTKILTGPDTEIYESNYPM